MGLLREWAAWSARCFFDVPCHKWSKRLFAYDATRKMNFSFGHFGRVGVDWTGLLNKANGRLRYIEKLFCQYRWEKTKFEARKIQICMKRFLLCFATKPLEIPQRSILLGKHLIQYWIQIPSSFLDNKSYRCSRFLLSESSNVFGTRFSWNSIKKFTTRSFSKDLP